MKRPKPLPKELRAWTEIVDGVPVTFDPLVDPKNIYLRRDIERPTHYFRPEQFAQYVPVNEGTETRSPQLPESTFVAPPPPREPDISYTRDAADRGDGTTTTGGVS